MTLLQLVNRVLRRLREDQVTDLTTDAYSKLVAEFVADAHREVVEAHDWSVMQTGLLVTLTSGQTSFLLDPLSADLYAGFTGGVGPKAIPKYINDQPVAYLYASHADFVAGNALHQMEQSTYSAREDAYYQRVGTTGRPASFSLIPSSNGLGLYLDQAPDQTYYLYILFQNPELEIDVDTDANRVLLAPTAPVYAGALYYALNERGEEMGEPGGVAERRYINAIGTAIETDVIRATRANTHEMYRD